MKSSNSQFHPLARLLHWLIAAMVISMLFIGVGMVASVSERHEWLIHLHKPLGIAILVLMVIRVAFRLTHRPPPLPEDLPSLQRRAAHFSHWLLYALLLTMPIVGWAMLSAGGYPVMLSESVRLPSIVPANEVAFAYLRAAHTYLAYLLFMTFIAHMSAALSHRFIRRDNVLASMTGRSPDA